MLLAIYSTFETETFKTSLGCQEGKGLVFSLMGFGACMVGLWNLFCLLKSWQTF